MALAAKRSFAMRKLEKWTGASAKAKKLSNHAPVEQSTSSKAGGGATTRREIITKACTCQQKQQKQMKI